MKSASLLYYTTQVKSLTKFKRRIKTFLWRMGSSTVIVDTLKEGFSIQINPVTPLMFSPELTLSPSEITDDRGQLSWTPSFLHCSKCFLPFFVQTWNGSVRPRKLLASSLVYSRGGFLTFRIVGQDCEFPAGTICEKTGGPWTLYCHYDSLKTKSSMTQWKCQWLQE